MAADDGVSRVLAAAPGPFHGASFYWRPYRLRGKVPRLPLTVPMNRWNYLYMKIDKQAGPDGSPAPVSPLVFRLDSHSGVPTYLQLVQQVEHALRLGYLRRGDQLPRVKDVVASLAINPNTVLKAYR